MLAVLPIPACMVCRTVDVLTHPYDSWHCLLGLKREQLDALQAKWDRMKLEAEEEGSTANLELPLIELTTEMSCEAPAGTATVDRAKPLPRRLVSLTVYIIYLSSGRERHNQRPACTSECRPQQLKLKTSLPPLNLEIILVLGNSAPSRAEGWTLPSVKPNSRSFRVACLPFRLQCGRIFNTDVDSCNLSWFYFFPHEWLRRC